MEGALQDPHRKASLHPIHSGLCKALRGFEVRHKALYRRSFAKPLGPLYTHTYTHFGLFFLQIWDASKAPIEGALQRRKGLHKARRDFEEL